MRDPLRTKDQPPVEPARLQQGVMPRLGKKSPGSEYLPGLLGQHRPESWEGAPKKFCDLEAVTVTLLGLCRCD